MRKFFTLILLFITICCSAQLEKALPKRPSPPRLVNDFANVLTEEQEAALESKVVAYDDSTSSEIAIVTLNTLEGYEDEEFAIALGREWGVGGKEFNNGIVILVAIKDRKIRIEVGYGLEGAIPDITAQQIIDNSITPEFKQENYYRGLDHAVDDIMKAAAGEYKAPPRSSGKKRGVGIGAIIFIIAMIFIFAGGRGGGRGGRGMVSRRGYGDIGAGYILGSLLGGRGGGGGWSGGGGGGGGFGGFGGGSFGGGGASGSW